MVRPGRAAPQGPVKETRSMPLTDHGRIRKQQFHGRLGVLHHRLLHRKLRQRFPAAFNTRWTRRHWLHASLFATLGALVATIVPGFSSQLPPASQAHPF